MAGVYMLAGMGIAALAVVAALVRRNNQPLSNWLDDVSTKQGIDPYWYRNSAYGDLGPVSSEWVSVQRRKQ